MTEHERTLARERKRRQRERQSSTAWQGKPPPHSAPQVPVGIVQPLDIPAPKHGLKIAYIPDVQAMPGVPLDHLTWCGKYLAEKQPDVIVIGGDFGDFPSLSHFGTKMDFEGARYKRDLAAYHTAMDRLMSPIWRVPSYDPWQEYIEGNHENHIERAVREDPKLEGLMSIEDLKLADYGWRLHRFMQPVSIGGVAFCHYFPSGVMGKPITTAKALLTKLHMSAVAGHQQGRDIAFGRRADGGDMVAVIAGSFYQHNYKYLSPFTNAHWRGMMMMHEVKDGAFDEMFVSMNFLKRKFG